MTEPVRDAVEPLARLAAIMARLRDPVHGCAWDVAQTWDTVARYTIEEAFEVADAIAREDAVDLKDELGDLLLQVVFHSRIAEELGVFCLSDVATAIANKMERRHPHIFAEAGSGDPDWERIKAKERQDRGVTGALDGIAIGLPALTRADKLQRRAGRVGFDWPDAQGPRAKIDEELSEVATATGDAVAEEIGDLLFAVTNWARHLGVDAETALRAANAKFERRFRAMEALEPDRFAELSLSDQESLWQTVKQSGG